MRPDQSAPLPPPLRREARRQAQRLKSLALDALERGTAFEREITEEEGYWNAQFEEAMRSLAGIKRK